MANYEQNTSNRTKKMTDRHMIDIDPTDLTEDELQTMLVDIRLCIIESLKDLEGHVGRYP